MSGADADARKRLEAAEATARAVAEAIKELGSVPSGVLYANLMGTLSLRAYETVIGILKDAGLVKEEAHLLTWIGD